MPVPCEQQQVDAAVSRAETELVIEFLLNSAERLIGNGIYSDSEYDPVAVHWMSEALELAAAAIERGEHYERPD